MADFLGEKEEITSTETLSYVANTIRDGANISQRYTKESVVSGSQIMDLTTGEAFVRFYGIPTVGKIKFKYHERKSFTAKTSKIPLNLDNKVIDISKKNEKETANIIAYLRSKYAHAIIIEKGREITKRFAENTDIILDPINGPYSWDIIEEFGNDIMSFIDFILEKSDFDNLAKRQLEDYFVSKINKEESQKLNKIDLLKDIIFYFQGWENSLKENFIFQFEYLKSLINNYQKVTLSRYLRGSGNILMFMPCNENSDLIKIANMIKTFTKDIDIFVIVDLNDIK